MIAEQSLKNFTKSAFKALGAEIKKAHRLDIDRERDLYERLFGVSAVDQRHFYNVGAGAFRHPFWRNVDKRSTWYEPQLADDVIDYDLFSQRPLPIDDGTARLFYSSHTIEHVDDASVLFLFHEMHRTLSTGGAVRVTAPNVELDYRAYRSGDRHHFYWADAQSGEGAWQRCSYSGPPNSFSLEQIFLSHIATNLSLIHADGASKRIDDSEFRDIIDRMPFEDAMNHIVSKCDLAIQRRYPGNHCNWWTPAKAVSFLKRARFHDVRVCGYGQSAVPVLRNTRIFDCTHPTISFYVEARK